MEGFIEYCVTFFKLANNTYCSKVYSVEKTL